MSQTKQRFYHCQLHTHVEPVVIRADAIRKGSTQGEYELLIDDNVVAGVNSVAAWWFEEKEITE